ncbi:MAG: hypothetical protein ACK4GN_12710 [Runella sp.]
MGVDYAKGFWWGMLGGGVGVVGWLWFSFDPIFLPSHGVILGLLPLLWLLTVGHIKWLQPDLEAFTPKNIMLFVWLNKLVMVPIELILIGNKTLLLNPLNTPPFIEVTIIGLSFLAFIIGWRWHTTSDTLLPQSGGSFSGNGTRWAIVYLSIGLVSLLFLYGSLYRYISGALFSYTTQLIMEDAADSLWGFLANIGQRFWPFGVILAWYVWRWYYPHLKAWYWHFPWLVCCLGGSLSSNRLNMLYPLLAFLSIMAAGWKMRYKWLWVCGAMLLIAAAIFFGFLRVQPSLNAQHVGELWEAYLTDDDYLWYAHQLYFGSPYQITPLLPLSPQVSTFWASVLDPVPILGKNFREQSGPFVYNMALYGHTLAQDKVIPMAGELYLNGGYGMVFLGHLIFGKTYCYLDGVFKKNVALNPPVAAAFFYLALLLNATLLQSLSVLVQLLIYNAPPALCLIAANWWYHRKRS